MNEIQIDQLVHAAGARALAHFLQEEMSSGRMPVGYKLPAERELGMRFQASRGAVRRVLANLKDRGLIKQIVGSGTYVAALPGMEQRQTHQNLGAHVSPAELMEGRILIEPSMPALIVQYATAVDFERMDECLQQSEAASTVEEFERWDGALHHALAEATHNNFVLQVMELVRQVREQGEWGLLKKKSLTQEYRTTYQKQHRSIVNALKDRDELTARQLIDQHLREVRQNLFGR